MRKKDLLVGGRSSLKFDIGEFGHVVVCMFFSFFPSLS